MAITEVVEKLFKSQSGPGSASYEIGRRARDLILQGRREADLTEAETSLLLKAYNWTGEHEAAFALARYAVQTYGEAFLTDLSRAHQNAYWWKRERFLQEADKLIDEKIGKSAFWRLRKADLLVGEATGDRHSEEEWKPGDPVVDVVALEQAAVELVAALADGVPDDPALQEGWNERFACVLSVSKFSTLRVQRRADT